MNQVSFEAISHNLFGQKKKNLLLNFDARHSLFFFFFTHVHLKFNVCTSKHKKQCFQTKQNWFGNKKIKIKEYSLKMFVKLEKN